MDDSERSPDVKSEVAALGSSVAGGDGSDAGRRRMRRVAGGRQRVVKVRVTEDEYAALEQRAAEAGVSIQRLLVGSVLRPELADRQWTEMRLVTLLAARRHAAAIGNNLNQLAHWANAERRCPAELPEVVLKVGRVVDELSDAVRELQ